MATQAFPFLQISDGVTNVTIADGAGGVSNYLLDALNWRPSVAGLSNSQLGGRGPYDDVLEELVLDITGATAAAAAANLQTLNRLIDQAERWSRGENVAVVLIKFAPQGSTVSTTAAPYQAVVTGYEQRVRGVSGGYVTGALGAVTSGSKLLLMPAAGGNAFVIPGCVLRFTRRGAWLLAAAVTGTSASITNPGPFPITGMTTHPNISPCQVTFGSFLNSQAFAFDFSDTKPIVLLAYQASDLQLANASSNNVGQFSAINDSANYAYATNVVRYTPNNTIENVNGQIDMSSMSAGARRFAFFAAVRNNSATTTFQIRLAALAQVLASPAYSIAAYTRLVNIDTAHTRPRFVPLGVVTLPAALQKVQLAVTASAAAGSLDINYVVALAVDSPYSRVIQLAQVENTGSVHFGNAWTIIVDPLPLSGLAPSVYRFASPSIDPLGYYGDAYPVASGTTFQGAIMAKGKGNGIDAYWTWFEDIIINLPVPLTLTCSRLNAFLIPE